MYSPEKFFITGYARLPKGITAAELYKVVGIGLTVQKESGVIIDADCSLANESGESLFREIVTGHNFNDIDKIIKKLNRNYLGHAKNALIAALKDAHRRYINYKENGYIDTEDYDED